MPSIARFRGLTIYMYMVQILTPRLCVTGLIMWMGCQPGQKSGSFNLLIKIAQLM
jgi:hypothetical protein